MFCQTYRAPALPRGVGGSLGGVTVVNSNQVNLPASGIGGFLPGSFNLTLFNSSLTRLLNLELQALEADGRGKIISSPRVVTADKIKAVIEQGTEIPYQQATSSGATSVAFRKAVLKLEVTPQITPEGAIFMDVKVNKDSRGQETLSGPAIDTKNVQTQVLVENGGTVVLGGIFEQQERTTVTKVPFLGDLPVVGILFKNTADGQRSHRADHLHYAARHIGACKRCDALSFDGCLKRGPPKAALFFPEHR